MFRFSTTASGIRIKRDPIAVVAVGGGGGGVIGRVEYQEASSGGDADCAIDTTRGKGGTTVDARGGGEAPSDLAVAEHNTKAYMSYMTCLPHHLPYLPLLHHPNSTRIERELEDESDRSSLFFLLLPKDRHPSGCRWTIEYVILTRLELKLWCQTRSIRIFGHTPASDFILWPPKTIYISKINTVPTT